MKTFKPDTALQCLSLLDLKPLRMFFLARLLHMTKAESAVLATEQNQLSGFLLRDE